MVTSNHRKKNVVCISVLINFNIYIFFFLKELKIDEKVHLVTTFFITWLSEKINYLYINEKINNYKTCVPNFLKNICHTNNKYHES